ncbi:MAG: NAD(P)H-hydrate dehydratase [Firmicutes bacterium]|nr:NAD(P)H-hydrate dehydratase [Bacillota bacterium]
MKKTELADVKRILRQRPAGMHKGQAGRVLIIAGSKGMAGAAALAARGALYSGAGLVKIAAPAEIFDILQTTAFEAMCIDRAELDDPAFDYSVFDAIAIGPGLGISEANVDLLSRVISGFEGPVVIDADGINCLCKRPQILNMRRGATVLTPHPGEAGRLLEAFAKGNYKELGRETAAKALADIPCGTGPLVVLLKGSETLVTSGGKMYVNTTGNPGMATGGSGDVLTGIIVSLIAQGMHYMEADPLDAVAASAYLHGLAGDIAAEKKGQYGMTSADLADAVAEAIKEVTGF